MAEGTNPRIKDNITLRAASGSLAVADNPDAVECDWAVAAVVTLNVTTLTLPDGDDEVDFYIQTRLNGEWTDVANVHFATANNGQTAKRHIVIPRMPAAAAILTPVDKAIADGTSANVPLGDAVRIAAKVTGATAPTYAYSAKVALYAD